MKVLPLLVSSFILFIGTDGYEDGDVRLADGTISKGRLEVFYAESWGTVCMLNTSRSYKGMAQAVCRQLGYYDYKNVDIVSKLNISQGTLPAIMSNVYCPYSGNPRYGAQHILRCEYYLIHTCSHINDVAIECSDENLYSFPYDTMVRLMDEDEINSVSSSSGFAEVYINDVWGPVCNLGMEDANSVCRQLSYTNAVQVEDMNSTMLDMKEVMDTFTCAASQSCLRQCFKYPKKSTSVDCRSTFSYVSCTYDVEQDDKLSSGSQSICTISPTTGVVGIVFGVLILLGAVVALATLLACFFIPGCFIHNKRKNYRPKLNYDNL